MVSNNIANISLILLSVCGTALCIAVVAIAAVFLIDIVRDWKK